jgi:hypothetical protein
LGLEHFSISSGASLWQIEPLGSVEIVKATLRGIRRTIGTAPNRKGPLTAERVRAMVKLAPDNPLVCEIGRCCFSALPVLCGGRSLSG